MVCVWRLVLATFACVGKSEGFCCWWSATGDPCDCSETSKASNLATSLACVDGGGSWCSEDGEQSAPEDGEQSAAVRRGRAVRARPGPRPEVPVGRFPAGAPPRTMAAPAYSKEEVSALRGIFALYDPDGTGEIGSNDLENLFKKIGFFNYAAVELIKQFDVEEPKTIDFAKFLEMVNKAGQPDQPGEEPDPKVLDGGEQSAPEDGSSSCACRSIMAGITDKWCQLSDCDPAFAAQCSSACPTALARAARTQAKSPAAPRARKVPRRVAARAAAAAAAPPPPPQRKPASAEKPQKKAPPFSSSASRALVDAPPPPPDASKRPARAAKQPLVPRVASLGVRPGAAGVPPRAKTPPPPPRRAPTAARTPPARPALMPPPPTSGGAARRVVVRDVRRAKVGANGGAKKPPPKKAPKLLEAGDPGALAAALSDAIQAADDPHHVRTLCEILARVKSS